VNKHRVIAVTAWALTACWLAAMVALLWPYNDVTFPRGNVGSVAPATVPELGTITVTFPEFCNYGQVTTTERWADIYDAAGTRVASEKLGTLTFYPVRDEPCRAPEIQDVGLTTAFKAYGGLPTTYRIRTVTSYQPNPIRIVRVEASTNPFVVTPR
jgi:hypothetical protein